MVAGEDDLKLLLLAVMRKGNKEESGPKSGLYLDTRRWLRLGPPGSYLLERYG